MKTNIVINISLPISCLAKFWFLIYGPKCCQPVKLKETTKFIFVMQINIEVFYKLILLFWVCIARLAQSIQIKKFSYLCKISRKAWVMNLLFYQQIDTNIFYKLILSLWVWKASYDQSSQNNKLANSLQYLSKEVTGEVDFFACKGALRFLTNQHYNFEWDDQAFPKFPK